METIGHNQTGTAAISVVAPGTWDEVAARQCETLTKDRSIRTEWVLASYENTDRDEPVTVEVVVDLTTRHFGRAEYVGRPDKVYLSSLGYEKRTRHTGHPRHTTHEYGLYSQKTALVGREAAPRFSAKTLAAVHAQALERLASNYERYPDLRAVFTEALDRHAPKTN